MTHRTATQPVVPVLTAVQLPTTLGLDMSDRTSHFHVLRGDGMTLSAGKVAMTREDLKALFSIWKGCRLVIETGGHSPWVSRLGKACGMEVVVANARKLALISKNDHKTDRGDARILAETGRTNIGLLHPITHRSEQAQIDLCVLRARDELVAMRTGLINHVRGVLKSNGHRAVKCSAGAFGKKALTVVPAELHVALHPIIQIITHLNTQIAAFEEEIERLCTERYEITKLLRQIGGVGPIVALSFVLTLDDPKRFSDGRDVGAFFGLVPRKQSSGDKDPQMHITKAGDRGMRRLLILAANQILGRFGQDSDLRRYGLNIAGSGHNKISKKRARVAVARKLAVLMHRLWKTGEVYDRFYQAKARGELAAV